MRPLPRPGPPEDGTTAAGRGAAPRRGSRPVRGSAVSRPSASALASCSRSAALRPSNRVNSPHTRNAAWIHSMRSDGRRSATRASGCARSISCATCSKRATRLCNAAVSLLSISNTTAAVTAACISSGSSLIAAALSPAAAAFMRRAWS